MCSGLSFITEQQWIETQRMLRAERARAARAEAELIDAVNDAIGDTQDGLAVVRDIHRLVEELPEETETKRRVREPAYR